MYLFDRPYSASFYSNGHVVTADSLQQLESAMDMPGYSFVAIKASRLDGLPKSLTDRLRVVQGYSRYVLMIESEPD